MHNTLTATWIIAAFMMSLLFLFSLLPEDGEVSGQDNQPSTIIYAIQSNDMATDG